MVLICKYCARPSLLNFGCQAKKIDVVLIQNLSFCILCFQKDYARFGPYEVSFAAGFCKFI